MQLLTNYIAEKWGKIAYPKINKDNSDFLI